MVSLSLFPLESGSTAFGGFVTAASVHACRQLRLGFHLRSSVQKLQCLSDAVRKDLSRYQRDILFNGAKFLQCRVDGIRLSLSSTFMCFFSGGGESRIGSSGGEEGSKRNTRNGRRWTNVLLAINVIMYIAQVASNGKVLAWGAKVNSLIDRGQFWRLATACVLHANPMHLLINCYSLNSIGPTAESLSGPKRYLAVYLTSAVASSAMSYWLNKAPSVGASGAIFGLVGSVAVYVIRHKQMVKGGNENLMQIGQVIALNMALGLASRGIDNWGHIGGLLGGTAMAWLVGPHWKYESTTRDGRRVYMVFMDKAPIPLLLRWRNGKATSLIQEKRI